MIGTVRIALAAFGSSSAEPLRASATSGPRAVFPFAVIEFWISETVAYECQICVQTLSKNAIISRRTFSLFRSRSGRVSRQD
jgi:hypothetical protein